jgi:hypothetical protein
MYCRHCGKEIDNDSKFCIHCGESSHLNHGADSSGEGETTKRPHERWSWGAFGLGWIYFCGMKYPFWGWLFVLGMVMNGLLKSDDTAFGTIGLIVWFIMIIIFGIKGRQIAWESRKWESKKEFIANQKAWDIWGIIIFVIANGIWFFIPLD